MNKFYTLVGGAFVKLFTLPTLLKGSQATAVTAIGDQFVGIGKILAEGNVSPEYGELAIAKMHEAQIAVNTAVQYGWNNGKGAEY